MPLFYGQWVVFKNLHKTLFDSIRPNIVMKILAGSPSPGVKSMTISNDVLSFVDFIFSSAWPSNAHIEECIAKPNIPVESKATND